MHHHRTPRSGLICSFAPARVAALATAATLWLSTPALGQSPAASEPGAPGIRPGLLYMGYSNAEGDAGGIAIIDLDPDSREFGSLVQQHAVSRKSTIHGLYVNRDRSRLYAAARGSESLYEVLWLSIDDMPHIMRAVPIDTQGQVFAGDMQFSEDGRYFYTAFLDGDGSGQGSIGVFDAVTNDVLDIVPAAGCARAAIVMYPFAMTAEERCGAAAMTSERQLDAGAGQRVMFRTRTGREVVAVYPNPFDPDGPGSGIIAVLDAQTGARLGEVDMRAKYKLLPRALISAAAR